MDPVTPPILRYDLGESICGQFLCGERRCGHNYASWLVPAGTDAVAIAPVTIGSGPILTPVLPENL